jgi:hypothetical protein
MDQDPPAHQNIESFLKDYFVLGDLCVGKPTDDDLTLIAEITTQVDEYFKRRVKYVLGLALDFVLLAQKLSEYDSGAKVGRPSLTEKELFRRYKLITKRKEKTANTLTLTFRGHQEGIRKIEEAVANFFHAHERSDYPSAYVYNTGQWQKFRHLLLLCFRLSAQGRLLAARKLLTYGLSNLPENVYYGREKPRVRIFEEVLLKYPRFDANENGGTTLQAIAHGFIFADRSHLNIIADKVRTGSARQKRFGDIDCYDGLHLELSVEVKDIDLSSENMSKELDSFLKKTKAAGILGMVVAKSASDDVRKALLEDGVVTLEHADLVALVHTWDWPKQNIALLAMLHHLAHIEQNVHATDRLVAFVRNLDPTHPAISS